MNYSDDGGELRPAPWWFVALFIALSGLAWGCILAAVWWVLAR